MKTNCKLPQIITVYIILKVNLKMNNQDEYGTHIHFFSEYSQIYLSYLGKIPTYGKRIY